MGFQAELRADYKADDEQVLRAWITRQMMNKFPFNLG